MCSDDEAIYSTEPLNPDTDNDGLFNATEVDIAFGTGCPNPINYDSDGDTLIDGHEVNIGTDPCNSDTDRDGIPDNIDPFPTDPGGTSGYIEDEIRSIGDFIGNIDLELFTGPNDNANQGRHNALSNRTTAAANEVADGNILEAITVLNNLLRFIDGIEPSVDWIMSSDEKEELFSRVSNVIELLEYIL